MAVVSAPQEPLSCPVLERIWSDPAYRAQMEAERFEQQRQAHAALTDRFNRAHAKRLAERGTTA